MNHFILVMLALAFGQIGMLQIHLDWILAGGLSVVTGAAIGAIAVMRALTERARAR